VRERELLQRRAAECAAEQATGSGELKAGPLM
jgi:hypothetical protein